MIYIVSGVARSGKSLIMQMLRAGGIKLSYDENYLPANEFNENGFFEYSNPDDLLADPDFVKEIDGQAINVVAHQFVHLPWRLRPLAKVIWVERNLHAIWKSQCSVHKKDGAEVLDFDEFMGVTAIMIKKSLVELKTYQHIMFSYEKTLCWPEQAAADLSVFLGLPFPDGFDSAKAWEPIHPRLRHFE